MAIDHTSEPTSDEDEGRKIRTSAALGQYVRAFRTAQKLGQIDVAGLAGTGNRFVVDLERGKPTLQLQKVLDVVDLLGLEVVVQPKRGYD